MANRNGRTLPEIPLMETGERDHFKAAKYELKNKNPVETTSQLAKTQISHVRTASGGFDHCLAADAGFTLVWRMSNGIVFNGTWRRLYAALVKDHDALEAQI